MRAVGRAAPIETRLYFTGGATAVLLGWRSTTVDVDIRFVPETDQVFRAIPSLKEDLQINVELASPADFIPELPGWRERSLFVAREERVFFYHYDPSIPWHNVVPGPDRNRWKGDACHFLTIAGQAHEANIGHRQGGPV